MTRLRAILSLRCPRCLNGRVFRTFMGMHRQCPQCGMQFYREQGYFVGAMYFSYLMSVISLGSFTLILSLLLPPDWSFAATIGIAFLCMVPLIPFIFRYSRIAWLHLDWKIDPPKS